MSKAKSAIPESDDEFSDSFDSQEDELEDELEEEEEDVGRRKRPAGGFILDEAEVDDLEESEEAEEDGYSDILRQQSENRRKEQEYLQKRRKKFLDLDDDDQIEQLVAKYESRKPEATVVPSRHRPLPGVGNPFLWLVKCTPGEERRLAFLLMRKALSFATKGTPLAIKSVLALDGLRGYLYIEAIKPTHVKAAIADVYGLQYAANSLKMVPIEEMTTVLRVTRPKSDVAPNSWVRFRKGLYKDDIAVILSCDITRGFATVKFIPRLNYTALAEMRPENTRGLGKTRPIAALFDSDKAQSAGVQFHSEGGFLVCRGRRFRNGFQVKRVPINSLVIAGVTPTIKEFEKFGAQSGYDAEDGDAVIAPGLVEAGFSVGDTVRVIGGEMGGTVGKVSSIRDDEVGVRPTNLDGAQELLFAKYELQKHFKVGDHVRVLSGQFKDESGIVVRVTDEYIVLLSDVSVKELRVLAKDIQLCNEKAIAYDDSGQFTVHDFVNLDPTTLGVVVAIEQGFVTVLDQYGELRKTRPQSLSRHRPFNAIFTDKSNNKVTVGDPVRVDDEHHKGIRGQFKHFYRGFVFVFSRLVTENANMIVTRAQNVVLDAPSVRPSEPETPIETSRIATPTASATPTRTPGSFVGLGRSPTIQKQPDMRTSKGKQITICGGPYKGHVGIVKDATPTVVRVELHSRNKIINVDVKNVEFGTNVASQKALPMKAPTAYNYTTFDRAGQATPSQDAQKTPRYGSMTPGHDVTATPSHPDEYFGVRETPAINDDLGITEGADMNFFKYQPFVSPSLMLPNLSDSTPTDPDSSSFGTSLLESLSSKYGASAEKNFENGTVVSISMNCLNPVAVGRDGVVVAFVAPSFYMIKLFDWDNSVDTSIPGIKIDRKFVSLKEAEVGDDVKVVNKNMALYGKLNQIDEKDCLIELDDKSLQLSGLEKISKFPIKDVVNFRLGVS